MKKINEGFMPRRLNLKKQTVVRLQQAMVVLIKGGTNDTIKPGVPGSAAGGPCEPSITYKDENGRCLSKRVETEKPCKV